jgi:hypothetical protein
MHPRWIHPCSDGHVGSSHHHYVHDIIVHSMAGVLCIAGDASFVGLTLRAAVVVLQRGELTNLSRAFSFRAWP